MHQLNLVPQLASLRSEFYQLETDGFVEQIVPVGYSLRCILTIYKTKSHTLFAFSPSPNDTLVPRKKRMRPTGPFTMRLSNVAVRLKLTWAVP